MRDLRTLLHVCTLVCTWMWRREIPKVRSHGDGALYPIRGGRLRRGVVDGGIDENGRRIQWRVHGRTKTIAARKLADLKAEVAQHGAPLGKSTTLGEWAMT